MLGYLYGKRMAQAIFRANLFQYKYPNILCPSYCSYLPAYEDGTECSETLAFKLQTPVNHPEESSQHSEHGKSLKSRIKSHAIFTASNKT
jgi:hypothetical protein